MKWGSPSTIKINLSQTKKLRLKCQYAGYPNANIQWLKNGGKITIINTQVIMKRKKSILVLENIEESDRGIYTCHAQNVLGNATIDFNVDIESSEDQIGDWKLCPIQDFCLNHGLCRHYPSIGEMLCL